MPVASVFTLGPSLCISDPRVILAYILRHIQSTPKHASLNYVDITMSIVDIVSNHWPSNPIQIKHDIETQLQNILQRVFDSTTSSTIVLVDLAFVNSTDINITIDCSVVVGNVPYKVTSTVSVSSDQRITFDIK